MRRINFSMATFAFSILIAAACLSHGTGDFVLEVQVHAYSNPTHGASAFATGFENQCCDGITDTSNTFCITICDNIFIFCFREAGRRDTNTNEDGGSNCLYGRNITEVIERDNDNLTFTVGENFPGGVPNPVVAFGQIWPGSIQLAIQILDHDFNMTEDDEVDIFFIDTNVTIGVDFSAPITYMGVNGYGQIQLSFRLNCTENYYGPDCATFCMERDDELGHYICVSDGSIVCRQGYQDPSSFCTICIPAEECSPDSGFCNVPGECICFDGYNGDNCLLDAVSSGVAVGVVVGGVMGGTIAGLLVLAVIILSVVIKRRNSSSHGVAADRNEETDQVTEMTPNAVDPNEEPDEVTEMTQNAAYMCVITTHPNDPYGRGQLADNRLASFFSAQNVAVNSHYIAETDKVDEEGYELLP